MKLLQIKEILLMLINLIIYKEMLIMWAIKIILLIIKLS